MLKAILLCGVPTSGKSTYADNLIKTDDYWKDSVILNTDYYVDLYAKQHNKTYNEVFYDVIRVALLKSNALFKFAIKNNKHIIWDQSNLTVSSRKEKLSMIPSNYKKIAVYFEISLDEALKRNELRKTEGKDILVSEFKIIYRNFRVPTLEEGFDHVERGNQA
jgi:predicted kinase